MSRILTLIAAASLLSLAACQSAPEKAPQAAAEQPAPAAAAPAVAAPAVAAPAVAAPAVAAPAAAPAMQQAPAEAAPAKAEPRMAKPAAPAPSVARPATISEKEALALAGKGNCLTCHKIEKRVVGPAWKDVAAKYRNDPNAVSTITAHIKSGGSFGWKFGVMPPRGGSQLSDADVAKLAGFIAGLK